MEVLPFHPKESDPNPNSASRSRNLVNVKRAVSANSSTARAKRQGDRKDTNSNNREVTRVPENSSHLNNSQDNSSNNGKDNSRSHDW